MAPLVLAPSIISDIGINKKKSTFETIGSSTVLGFGLINKISIDCDWEQIPNPT